MEEFTFEEIPEKFHQDGEKCAFKQCTFCGESLYQENQPYMIEKVFKRNLQTGHLMTMIEYAICLPCGIKKSDAISEESKLNIQAYLSEQLADVIQHAKETSKNRLASCAITNKSVEEMEEFSMVGQFVNGKMLVKEFPFVLDSSIGEEIQDLLSEETKREFDDFLDTITDIPPELRSLLRTNRPVLV